MEESKREYEQLCRAVEKRAGRKMMTPRDYDFLSVCIEQITRQHISVSTLKRLWGYLGEKQSCNPRQFTLDTLSRYVGYKNYDAFAAGTSLTGETDSDFVTAPSINASQIEPGTRIRIMWRPDRVMIIRCEGDHTFVVEQVENSKLNEGDCFCCDAFTQGEPLFVYNLIHDNNKPSGYVCGRLGGITYDIL